MNNHVRCSAYNQRYPMKHIVIAGAGILGASLAYHLAKRGARVTIIEAQHPAAGATGKSFGWLNATFSKRPRSYFDFSMLGIAGWHRLEQELNGELNSSGAVVWLGSRPDRMPNNFAGTSCTIRNVAMPHGW
jgi:glycine/D-amino acid oxidase-like deaminating enzyme